VGGNANYFYLTARRKVVMCLKTVQSTSRASKRLFW